MVECFASDDVSRPTRAMSQEKMKKKTPSKETEGAPPQTLAEKLFLYLLCASCIVYTLLITFYPPFRVVGIGNHPSAKPLVFID